MDAFDLAASDEAFLGEPSRAQTDWAWIQIRKDAPKQNPTRNGFRFALVDFTYRKSIQEKRFALLIFLIDLYRIRCFGNP